MVFLPKWLFIPWEISSWQRGGSGGPGVVRCLVMEGPGGGRWSGHDGAGSGQMHFKPFCLCPRVICTGSVKRSMLENGIWKGCSGHVQSGLENIVCDPAWKHQFLSKCCVSPEVPFRNKHKFVFQVSSTLNVLNQCLVSSWCVCATKVLGRWRGQKWCTQLTPSWSLKSRYDDDIWLWIM